MLLWFSTNSAAIQAISAALSPVLTIALFTLTWRYVTLTSRIAQTTQEQLSASLQPLIRVVLESVSTGSSVFSDGSVLYNLGPRYRIENIGKTPVKLKDLYLIARLQNVYDFEQHEYPMRLYYDRLLFPESPLLAASSVTTTIDYSITKDTYVFGLRVDCTDLAELVTHSFYVMPDHSMKHTFTRTMKDVGFWADIKEAIEKLRRRWIQLEDEAIAESQKH